MPQVDLAECPLGTIVYQGAGIDPEYEPENVDDCVYRMVVIQDKQTEQRYLVSLEACVTEDEKDFGEWKHSTYLVSVSEIFGEVAYDNPLDAMASDILRNRTLIQDEIEAGKRYRAIYDTACQKCHSCDGEA